MHKGLSLYFEPLKENAAFPFREIAREDGADRITSYRLHVFPVIPPGATTLAELQESNLPQQVNMIEWSLGGPEPRDGDDYSWACDLCRSTEADLGAKPEITELSFGAAASDQMNSEVNTRLRRLELEELRQKRRRPR